MAGRPTKLTTDTQQKIVQAIELGATYELASQYGGISYAAFNDWMNRGKAEIERLDSPRAKERAEEVPFVQFFNAIKEAEGRAAVKWLAKIEAAATDTWQAAAWKLERRYPKVYGRTVVGLTDGDGNPLPAPVIYLPDIKNDDDSSAS